MSRQWSETFRALGSAILALLKAELEAFEQDLGRSAKAAALGVALFAVAGAFGFWTLGVATYFLIQLLALWLPLWGASLAVTLLFGAIAAVLALIGMRKLERFENPVTTARERIDDHIDWWQRRVLSTGEKPAIESGPGERGDGEDGERDDADETGGRS